MTRRTVATVAGIGAGLAESVRRGRTQRRAFTPRFRRWWRTGGESEAGAACDRSKADGANGCPLTGADASGAVERSPLPMVAAFASGQCPPRLARVTFPNLSRERLRGESKAGAARSNGCGVFDGGGLTGGARSPRSNGRRFRRGRFSRRTACAFRRRVIYFPALPVQVEVRSPNGDTVNAG